MSKRTLPDKKCSTCSAVFRPHNSLMKFCSYPCAVKGRQKKGAIKQCIICGVDFYSMPGFFATSKYCSTKCQHQGLKKEDAWVTNKCLNCGKDYEVRSVQVKWRGSSFCSMRCFKGYKKTKFYETKKKKSTNNAKLKKQLWGIFSQYIRQRDKGICISCGKQDYWRKMDAGHYIPKTAGLSLYFDERNVNCQCTYCNRWMHGNLAPYALALIAKYGQNILQELDTERHKIRKISDDEYGQLIEMYKQRLQEILSTL